MKKATVICMCDKAGKACETCEQGDRIKPDHIFHNPKWTWKNKEFKTIKR